MKTKLTGYIFGAVSLLSSNMVFADHNWCHKQPNLSLEKSYGKLSPGQVMMPGTALCSASGKFILACQPDGNIVIYKEYIGTQVVWASNTSGKGTMKFCAMQGDGNFVAYDVNNVPLYHTSTHGNPGAYLMLHDDGKFSIVKDLKVIGVHRDGTVWTQ